MSAKCQIYLFLEQAEGYVKTLGKSTFPSSTVRGFLNTVPSPPGIAHRIMLRKTGISPPRVIPEPRANPARGALPSRECAPLC